MLQTKLIILFSLVSLLGTAAPISRVILDLDETIIQRNQEFVYKDGKLVPSLESFEITAPYPDGTTQHRVYYIRPGAREFLTYLANEKLEFGFLSKSHQARLNAVLEAIKINNAPLAKHVKFAFGQEIVNAYSLLKRPDQKRKLKDFDIVFHPKAKEYNELLKRDDRSFLPNLTIVNSVVPNDTLMIDDSPDVTAKDYQPFLLKLRDIEKTEEFWKKYQKFVSEPESLEISFERHNFLANLEVEKHQFDVIRWLMEDAKKNPLPNDYTAWEKMLDAPQILVTEKIHFRYLISDLLREDRANQDVIIVGRDMDLFNEVMDQVKDSLEIKSRLVYIPMSRVVAINKENILKVLAANSIDIKKIISGERHLKFVDGGYRGTVPGNVIEAIFGDVPNWQESVQNVSAHLFTSETQGGPKDPKQFRTLKEYVAAYAFVKPSPHQQRFGADNLREVILHWEHSRPKKHTRPYRLNESDFVAQDNSHPTENRAARLFDYVIRKLFWEDTVISEMKALAKQELPAESKASGVDTPKVEIKVASIPTISKIQRLKYFTLRHSIRFLQVFGIDLSKYRPTTTNSPKAAASDAAAATKQVDKPSHRGDPRSRRLNPYDNSLSPEWTAWLEDKKNITRSVFDYVPAFAPREHKATEHVPEIPLSEDTLLGLREQGRKFNDLGSDTQVGKRKNSKQLLKLDNKKVLSTDSLEQIILSLGVSYLSDIENSALIFRSTDFQSKTELRKAKDLQREWHWFVHWLHLQMNRPYSPYVLAAQVHYLLTEEISPFSTKASELTFDIMDMIYSRAGKLPPAWDELSAVGYKKGASVDIEAHVKLIAELEKRPRPKRTRSAENQCYVYYSK